MNWTFELKYEGLYWLPLLHKKRTTWIRMRRRAMQRTTLILMDQHSLCGHQNSLATTLSMRNLCLTWWVRWLPLHLITWSCLFPYHHFFLSDGKLGVNADKRSLCSVQRSLIQGYRSLRMYSSEPHSLNGCLANPFLFSVLWTKAVNVSRSHRRRSSSSSGRYASRTLEWLFHRSIMNWVACGYSSKLWSVMRFHSGSLLTIPRPFIVSLIVTMSLSVSAINVQCFKNCSNIIEPIESKCNLIWALKVENLNFKNFKPSNEMQFLKLYFF